MMRYLKLLKTITMNHKYSPALDVWMLESLKSPKFSDEDKLRNFVNLNGKTFWIGNGYYWFHIYGQDVPEVRPSRLTTVKFFEALNIFYDVENTVENTVENKVRAALNKETV